MKPALPLILSAALALPFLGGCTAAVIGGTAAGVATIHDRRTAGTVIEDQNIKLRVRNLLSENPAIKERSNISVTSYNQRVLLYGQTEDAALAEEFARKPSRSLRCCKRLLNFSFKELREYLEFETDELTKMIGPFGNGLSKNVC